MAVYPTAWVYSVTWTHTVKRRQITKEDRTSFRVDPFLHMIYNMYGFKIKMAPFALTPPPHPTCWRAFGPGGPGQTCPLYITANIYMKTTLGSMCWQALWTLLAAETVKGSVLAWMSRLCPISSQYWRFIFMHTHSRHASALYSV